MDAMEADFRNKNRGYQQLRVWQDATDLYVLTCRVFRTFPYELRRVVSQAIASADSVHRNIAEGYCRRSLREYLYHLNISLGSLGESVSGLLAYRKAEQLPQTDFDALNSLSFKLENGLLKLVESLERKQETGDWIDHLIIKESNVTYGAPCHSSPPQDSITPPLHHPTTQDSITPPLHYSAPPHHSTTPSLHHSIL
jgi:four helix bundle protein